MQILNDKKYYTLENSPAMQKIRAVPPFKFILYEIFYIFALIDD